MTFPKIELHVHLEGTVRAATLLDIARRNEVPLPADTGEGLASLYEFTDFAHFLRVWKLTTGALRTDADFRQVVTGYAAEAASHGAVYLEGIISPSEHVERGCDWDAVMTGFCDGAQQALELHGVHVRLTPDVNRGYPVEAAEQTARYAVRYADRGVVGLGLGGPEAQYPPEPFARAFAIAADGGLGSVPHAGEAAGPSPSAAHSTRCAPTGSGTASARWKTLAWSASWPTAASCLTSARCRTCAPRWCRRWPSIRCPRWSPAGVPCTVSTDDPAMFDTDLAKDYAAAAELGVSPADCFQAACRARSAAAGSGPIWRSWPLNQTARARSRKCADRPGARTAGSVGPASTMWPGVFSAARKNAQFSETRCACCMLCVTMTIVTWSSSSLIVSSIRRVEVGSSAEQGSSISSTSGEMASDLAMHSRCCWPPDSAPPGDFSRRCTSFHSPALRRLDSTRPSTSGTLIPASFRPLATLS